MANFKIAYGEILKIPSLKNVLFILVLKIFIDHFYRITIISSKLLYLNNFPKCYLLYTSFHFLTLEIIFLLVITFLPVTLRRHVDWKKQPFVFY